MGRVSEAAMYISGQRLTDAQSMTVRVALNDFIMSLRWDGLGDDEIAKNIVEGYTARASEVLTIIHKELDK